MKCEVKTFTCQQCHTTFKTASGSRFKFCPSCRKSRKAIQDRAANGRGSGFAASKFSKTTFEIVRHDDEDGFLPGSRFPGTQMMMMIRDGYVKNAVVKSHGQILQVINGTLVEFKEETPG